MGGAAANPGSSSVNPNWVLLKKKLAGGRSDNSHNDHGVSPKSPSVLGKRKERPDAQLEATPAVTPTLTAAELLKPSSSDCSLTDALAMDCEMVGVGSQGTKSAIARVVLVNTWGNVVYDEYVRPLERVVDFRTKVSGIRPKHLRKAKDFRTVQNDVSALIKGRTLVGHALHNDLKALLLSHTKSDIRDTAQYQPFLNKEGRRRALRDLAAQILGVSIQQGEHCPVEDARAAMMIYQKHKRNWEKQMKRQLRHAKKKR
ncbi:polynucleotidyl transferase, ribonuclease H-like superfamily protein [Wolffia australiana]